MINLAEYKMVILVNAVVFALTMSILLYTAIQITKILLRLNGTKKAIKVQRNISMDFTEETEKGLLRMQEFFELCNKSTENMEKLIYSEQFSELGAYIDQFIEPAANKQAKDPVISTVILNIKIPVVRAIVYKKIQAAYEYEIDVITDIPNTVELIEIDKLELISILGVLLDNAIEAATEADKKVLFLGFYQNKNGAVIKIGNSCKNIPDFEEIYNWGYTTKEKGHGIGLSNVKQIIEKHRGAMDTLYDKEAELFIQELIV